MADPSSSLWGEVELGPGLENAPHRAAGEVHEPERSKILGGAFPVLFQASEAFYKTTSNPWETAIGF